MKKRVISSIRMNEESHSYEDLIYVRLDEFDVLRAELGGGRTSNSHINMISTSILTDPSKQLNVFAFSGVKKLFFISCFDLFETISSN